MGTTKSSESLAFADYLRQQREQSQAEVDAAAEGHGAQVRYTPHDRHHPAAH